MWVESDPSLRPFLLLPALSGAGTSPHPLHPTENQNAPPLFFPLPKRAPSISAQASTSSLEEPEAHSMLGFVVISLVPNVRPREFRPRAAVAEETAHVSQRVAPSAVPPPLFSHHNESLRWRWLRPEARRRWRFVGAGRYSALGGSGCFVYR
ncbi:hypothetical protein J1605_001192 [Eschrichtius robustus]|uniref:Uncharacterized protein n=1 Tax=Eschrichtius robustus TaxID=9764 RepID=A0AB34GEG1_ESCRO|nr:hypothetical protein J1605_001192 [Eschrichtius robustus]